jgi:amino acid permease
MDEQQKNSDSNEQQKSQNVEEQESQDQTKKHTFSRRQFLIISAITAGVAGTGLLIGFNVNWQAEQSREEVIHPSCTYDLLCTQCLGTD